MQANTSPSTLQRAHCHSRDICEFRGEEESEGMGDSKNFETTFGHSQRRVASLSALITSPSVVPNGNSLRGNAGKFENVNGHPLNIGNAFNHEIRR